MAALAACSPSSGGAGASDPPGDWLVYGDTVEPSTLNCARATDRAAWQVCRLVCDSLVDFDASLSFVPRLAESFSFSGDGLTLTLRLREGVTWHDGRPFTARDVLYTVELLRALDGGRRHQHNFGPLASVAAPDDRTVVASYREPFSGALTGWRETLILPAHIPVDPAASVSPLDRAPVGTGPFRFLRWDPQQQVVLEANESYFGGPPGVRRYVHRIVPSLDTLRAAAQAGEVDVAPLGTDWLRANPPPHDGLPFRVVAAPTRYVQLVYWNLDEPRRLFADPRVRRSMTMLLDREGYASRVHAGSYRTALALTDPWGGRAGARPLPFDPSEASRLLDEADLVDRDGDGVRDTPSGPFAFTLLYTSGANPDFREIASLFERQAAAAGVKVALQGLDWPMMKPRVQARDFEAAVYQWGLEPLPDPYPYLHSSQIGPGFNFGAYRSGEVDRICEETRRTHDRLRVKALLAELQGILDRDQPHTIVAVPGTVTAVARRFRTPDLTEAGLWNWYPGLLAWRVPASERKHR